MEASRRQPGMLQGLSRFLVQHERCGAGFDVAHPAGLGSGRVSITCRGCGARHEYATATIEVERELKIEPADAPPQPRSPLPPPPRRPSAPIPPRPAPYPESTRRPVPPVPPARARPPVGAKPPTDPRPPARSMQSAGAPAPPVAASPTEGRLRPTAPPRQPPPTEGALRRFWRSPRATMALLIVAAVAVGMAVVRLVNEGGSNGTRSAPAPTQSTPIQPLVPTTPTKPSTPVPGPPPPAAATTLRTQRFTLQAPAGWTDRTSAGGLLLQPSGGGRANVQVFFQRSPGLSRNQMADQTARFLRREVPDASLFPRQIRIGGLSAHEITARGPGETAIAVDVLRGPYRYLLLRRIFVGARPQVSLAASRVVLSFRPR